MAAPTSLRVQTLSGLWETIGVERYPGLFPEGVRPTADLFGPAAFSFTLQRNPDVAQLDLLAWTPAELEVAGKTVWEGRIRETPGTHGAGGGLAVQAEGWQAHWDDDVLERTWIHQDLTAWQDSRSNLGQNLALWWATPNITAGAGQIAIAIPNGTVVPAGYYSGVTLDLGPGNLAASCIVDATVTGGNNDMAFYVRASATPDASVAPIADADGSGSGTATGTTQKIGGPFPTPYRYVSIFLWCALTFTAAADLTFAITRAVVAVGNYLYISTPILTGKAIGGQGTSDLRASDVILDTAAAALPLLTASLRSPAYHDELLADLPSSYWRLGNNIVAPPAGVTIPAGGIAYADLGSLNNPVSSIANVSVVPGLLTDDGDTANTFAGNTSFLAVSNPGFYTGAPGSLEALCRPSNVGHATLQDVVCLLNRMLIRINAAGKFELSVATGAGGSNWTANAVTPVNGVIYHLIFTYDGEAVTANASLYINGVPAALTLTAGTGFGLLNTATSVAIGNEGSGFTQGFFGTIDEASVFPYALSLSQALNHYQTALARQFGSVQRSQYKIPSYAPQGARTFREHAAAANSLHGWRLKTLIGRTIMFQPQPATALLRAASTVEFTEAAANTGTDVYNRCIVEANDITGVPVRATVNASQIGAPTAIDRRGFTRTKILTANNAIDHPTAVALATAFLNNNSTLPFRGSFTAGKPDDVLVQPGDIPVHPSELLLHTNELIRLPLINPDTGDIGRDGKIALVTYDEATETASVTIDDDRTSFDALLARMAVTASSRGV